MILVIWYKRFRLSLRPVALDVNTVALIKSLKVLPLLASFFVLVSEAQTLTSTNFRQNRPPMVGLLNLQNTEPPSIMGDRDLVSGLQVYWGAEFVNRIYNRHDLRQFQYPFFDYTIWVPALPDPKIANYWDLDCFWIAKSKQAGRAVGFYRDMSLRKCRTDGGLGTVLDSANPIVSGAETKEFSQFTSFVMSDATDRRLPILYNLEKSDGVGGVTQKKIADYRDQIALQLGIAGSTERAPLDEQSTLDGIARYLKNFPPLKPPSDNDTGEPELNWDRKWVRESLMSAFNKLFDFIQKDDKNLLPFLNVGHIPIVTDLNKRSPVVTIDSYLREGKGYCIQNAVFASMLLTEFNIRHKIVNGLVDNTVPGWTTTVPYGGHTWIEVLYKANGQYQRGILDPYWGLFVRNLPFRRQEFGFIEPEMNCQAQVGQDWSKYHEEDWDKVGASKRIGNTSFPVLGFTVRLKTVIETLRAPGYFASIDANIQGVNNSVLSEIKTRKANFARRCQQH